MRTSPRMTAWFVFSTTALQKAGIHPSGFSFLSVSYWIYWIFLKLNCSINAELVGLLQNRTRSTCQHCITFNVAGAERLTQRGPATTDVLGSRHDNRKTARGRDGRRLARALFDCRVRPNRNRRGHRRTPLGKRADRADRHHRALQRTVARGPDPRLQRPAADRA